MVKLKESSCYTARCGKDATIPTVFENRRPVARILPKQTQEWARFDIDRGGAAACSFAAKPGEARLIDERFRPVGNTFGFSG